MEKTLKAQVFWNDGGEDFTAVRQQHVSTFLPANLKNETLRRNPEHPCVPGEGFHRRPHLPSQKAKGLVRKPFIHQVMNRHQIGEKRKEQT